jgi:arylsulfatase A-like enzyme
MSWLDPAGVPTMGDWFRAGGYTTHYRGKWHVSHADLPGPDGVEGLAASDDDGRVLPDGVAAYRSADRLDTFGFSGWIGREPHGVAKSNSGTVRDPLFAEQVVELFDELAVAAADGPWLAVASFVNPHDIAFAGGFYELLLGFDPSDDTVPDVPEAPSQADSFEGRPACQELFTQLWPIMVVPQPTDLAYRRLYYYLLKLVDQAIGRILDALEASGMAEDTIVAFTSDHGDLVGAHGGMRQKWANAYDEALRVPMVVKGPGIVADPDGISAPTSHVDLIPTLMGLAGIDVEQATEVVRRDHRIVQPFVGRDLSGVLTGSDRGESLGAPIYFMTDDEVTRGATQQNVLTGERFEALDVPARIESVLATLPSGESGAPELWKLNHYHDGLADWHESRGVGADRPGPPAASEWELHRLSVDPEERVNLAADPAVAPVLAELQRILESERDAKRLLPGR